ncbi:MAG: GNVR domain-containing protein [Gallionella sp.]|jgi:uncharacterized protein involved in exopolysaccharide biosynthesis
MQANQTAVQQVVQDDEINLMDLLLVIAKHNRFIIKLTLGAAVLAVIYALMQPNIYTAKTVLMPPQQPSSSTSALLGQLGGLAGMAGGALGVKNPSDLYAGMLKSHMIEDALIKRFKLMELYQEKTMEPVRAALEGSTVVAAGKNGFITVEYSDKDPKLAAAIANAYVEELDSLVRAQAAREALGRKQFYEKQLADVRADLGRAELEMKVFQEQNRVFQLGGGAGVALGASGGIPKAELEYVRIARDVKYSEMFLAAMAQQVTSATIDAAKNLSTLQVLDKALVPEKKSKPKRAMIVMLATILAFFIGIIWAFVREAGERSGQNPEQNERMNLLRRYFRQGK